MRVGSLERDKPLPAGWRPWGTGSFRTFLASALFELYDAKCVRVVGTKFLTVCWRRKLWRGGTP